MQILMLSDVFFPRVNGVSTSIQTFAGSFLEQGHSLTLIAPEYATGHEAGFDIIRIPARTLPFDPEDRLMSLRAIKRLLPRLRATPFDVIHIQTPFVAHYAGVWLGRQLGLPTVVSYHTYFEAYFEKYLPWLPKALLRFVARSFSRRQCTQVDCLVSPSTQMLRRLREYGISGCAAVIPTGLPATSFASTDIPGFRSKFDIPADAFLLLYAGRVAHEKNIGFLIEMFARICRNTSDTMLLIAGEGPALSSLQRRAEESGCAERIRFIGYLERRHELLSCYQSADLFVFASQTETQGLVLLEAMASGLPVVSTASMGSRDVLVEGEGCLVSPLEVAPFVDCVMTLYRDRGLAAELSRKGQIYAQGWRDDVKAREMLALYRRVSTPGSFNDSTDLPGIDA